MATDSWWGDSLLERWPSQNLWAVAGSRAVTLGELRRRVGTLVPMFARHGIRPESTVALRMRPSLTLIWSLLALWTRGAQVIVVDARLKPAESASVLALCDPEFLVYDEASLGTAAFDDEVDIIVTRRPGGRSRETDVCLVQFSSGSTGRPKVIGRTPGSLHSELDRYAAIDGMPEHGERVLVLASVVHTWGLIGGVLHGLNCGVSVVFAPSLLPHDLAALSERSGVSAIFGVPTHFGILGMAVPPLLPRLRLAVSAGEIMSDLVFDRFMDRYRLPICPVYGMTEVGVIAGDLRGHCRPPQVGAPVAGVTVEVRRGELYVQMSHSPYLFPDQAAQFADGWLRTYDRCTQDSGTGVLSILGRADSVVAIGGLKVDLMEVETALCKHEQVTEAVVVYTEAIEAYVAAAEGLDANTLIAWCRNRLSNHKIPKRFYIGPALPRSVNGKIIRDAAQLRVAFSETRSPP
jgi:3-hydroxy-4-methylanthranilate adenylyltransferase